MISFCGSLHMSPLSLHHLFSCGWEFPHISAEPGFPHKVTTTNPGITVTFYSCKTGIQESCIAHASKRHCRNSCGVALVLAVVSELALLATP